MYIQNDNCTDVITYLTYFISMRKSNIEKYKGHIRPVDDVVFIYDIDNTLYKYTNEHKDLNKETYIKIYNSIAKEHKKTSDEDLPDLESALKEGNIMVKLFRDKLKKTPIELEKLRDDIDLATYIKRDENLIEFFKNSKYRIWCFTNGLESRARKILDILDITEHIEGVICHDDLDEDCISKPKKNSYEFVETILGIKDKSLVYFFDDNAENIEEARKMGWNGILVKEKDNIIDLSKEVLKKLN